MTTDRSVNHLLVHYVAMTDRFGYLNFRKFVEQWESAGAIAETLQSAGLELDAELVLAPVASRVIKPKNEQPSATRAWLIRATLLSGPLLN